MVLWFCNGVFIGLCCLTTYNTCSVVYNCYQYISNSIATHQQYHQDGISWAKYVLVKQDEINMINYLTGKEETCNANRNGSNAGISVSYSEGQRRSPEEYEFLHNVMMEYPKKDASFLHL